MKFHRKKRASKCKRALSGIKYVCNKRLKNNSARDRWLIESIRGLMKLRIIWFNNYFDDFWKFRSKKLKKKYELKIA